MELYLIPAAIAVVASFLLFATVMRRRSARKIEAAMVAIPFAGTRASSGARESTPPSSDGAKSVARAITPREQRQEEIRARRDTSMCLYCDKQASFATPQLVLIRPLLDPLYRRLNVVPVNRWKIVLEPDTEALHDVCTTHQAIARSHLERKVAENQVDYAAFVERQRFEMYSYETYELDERMLDDANVARRGKKQKKGADVMPLQRGGLKVANGA
jgi:hypothetical protein